MTRTVTMLIMAAIVIGGSTTRATAQSAVDGGEVAQQPRTPAPASHAVRGVVKSVSATSLVITRSGGKPRDLTFVLELSTSRAGMIAAGVTVSVRYRTEGDTLVATAVTSRVTTRQGIQ